MESKRKGGCQGDTVKVQCGRSELDNKAVTKDACTWVLESLCTPWRTVLRVEGSR